MNPIRARVLFTLLAGIFFLARECPRAALPCDFLKTDGTIIRNNAGAGDTVQLCGVNVGGWLLQEPWMSPMSATCEWTARQTLTSRFGAATMWSLYDTFWDSFLKESDFPRIAGEGLNMIRLVMYYHNHMDENGNWRLKPNSTIDFSRLDWAVSTAAKYGIYTVLDLHGVPGSQNGQDHSGQVGSANLFTDTAWQSKAIKFWQGLASHFNGNSAVAGYDLMNEPSENFPNWSGPAVFAMHDRLFKAVRSVDPDHIIIINFCWPWYVAPDPAVNQWSNVVYEVHNYGDPIDSSVKWANDCRNNYHIPYYIGEFTYSTAANFNNAMTQFTRIGINWSPWTYKVKSAGSSWGMYTGGGATPNLATETSASIATKWGQWDTDTRCTRNSMVCDAMKAATSLITIRRAGAAVCIPTSIQAQKRSSAPASAKFRNSFRIVDTRLVIPREFSGSRIAVFDLSGRTVMNRLLTSGETSVDVSRISGKAPAVLIVRFN